MFADHLTAEHKVKTTGRGRDVDEWKIRAEGTDNHFFDCVVGAAVAASMVGCSPPDNAPPVVVRKHRQQVRLADLLAARGRR